MASSSTTFLKRKVTFGDLNADFDNMCLLARYKVSESSLDEYGEAIHTETKQYQKRIQLTMLNADTSIPMLAQQIVDQCEFIGAGRVGVVIGLLYELQSHLADTGGELGSSFAPPKSPRQSRTPTAKTQPSVTLDDADDALDKLYDENMQSKVAATQVLAQLSVTVGNLQPLVNNEALMGAMTRVLNEDYRRSIDLTTNIMTIFCNMSTFHDLHAALMEYRVGDITMRVLELENSRYQSRQQEMERLAQLADAQQRGDKQLEARLRSEWQAGEDASKQRAKSAKSKKGRDKDVKAMPVPDGRVDLAAAEKQSRKVLHKQDKLLLQGFSLLLNLAEDIHVEKKMCKRGIVRLLVPLFSRSNNNPRVLLLAVHFCRKLAVFEENMRQMASAGLVGIIARLVPVNQEVLLSAVLRLLFNLSFEPSQQSAMLAAGLVPKLVALLPLAPLKSTALQVLYHISMDERSAAEFADTNCILSLVDIIVRHPKGQPPPPEVMALAVNLSALPKCAHAILDSDGLSQLVARAVATKDSLVMKIVRNVSQFTFDAQSSPDRADRPSASSTKSGNESGASRGGKAHRSRSRARDSRHSHTQPAAAGDGVTPGASTGGGTRSRSRARATSRAASSRRVRSGAGDRQGAAGPSVAIPAGVWAPLIDGIVGLARDGGNDMLLEVMGTLANITCRDLALPRRRLAQDESVSVGESAANSGGTGNEADSGTMSGWSAVERDHKLVALLDDVLQRPSTARNKRLLLQLVMLVGTLAEDDALATALAASNVISHLVHVLGSAATDYDVVLQAMFSFHRLLMHQETSDVVVYGTDFVAIACDAMGARGEMHRLADACLNICLDVDRERGSGEVTRRILHLRFSQYNRDWLAAVGVPPDGAYSSADEAQARRQQQLHDALVRDARGRRTTTGDDDDGDGDGDGNSGAGSDDDDSYGADEWEADVDDTAVAGAGAGAGAGSGARR